MVSFVQKNYLHWDNKKLVFISAEEKSLNEDRHWIDVCDAYRY